MLEDVPMFIYYRMAMSVMSMVQWAWGIIFTYELTITESFWDVVESTLQSALTPKTNATLDGNNVVMHNVVETIPQQK